MIAMIIMIEVERDNSSIRKSKHKVRPAASPGECTIHQCKQNCEDIEDEDNIEDEDEDKDVKNWEDIKKTDDFEDENEDT